MAQMEDLYLYRSIEPHGGLAELVALTPRLSWLGLTFNDWVSDLAPLTGLTGLTGLYLAGTGVSNLEPLADNARMRFLDLSVCPGIVDLAPLAHLSELRELSLRGIADDVDLSPLAGHRRLIIDLFKEQKVRGADRLHPGVRLEYR